MCVWIKVWVFTQIWLISGVFRSLIWMKVCVFLFIEIAWILCKPAFFCRIVSVIRRWIITVTLSRMPFQLSTVNRWEALFRSLIWRALWFAPSLAELGFWLTIPLRPLRWHMSKKFMICSLDFHGYVRYYRILRISRSLP